MNKPVILSAMIALLPAPAAIAQTPVCYQVTSKGSTVDLSSLCTNKRAQPQPILISDLSLDVPDEEFLSSRVKAKLTNRSQQPVQVSVVMLQINRLGRPVTTVPLFVNQVLSPGQSIVTNSIFDKASLNGQDPKELSVSVQSLK